jgi:hypothetical protein
MASQTLETGSTLKMWSGKAVGPDADGGFLKAQLSEGGFNHGCRFVDCATLPGFGGTG